MTKDARRVTPLFMSDMTDNIPKNAPIILGLEASGDHASAAITQGSTLLAEARIDQKHGHASHFVSLAADIVEQAKLTFSDITHIAAGVGPGSFTGLRVCLSAAKGFVLAGDLIGIGINGLRARAFAAQDHAIDGTIISCADTRRGSYFMQTYDTSYHAKSAISEATLEELQEIDKADDTCRIILPPHQDGSTRLAMIDMTARHIALLAAHDIAHKNPLLALDALYVAEPKLGPSKKVAS